MTDTKPIAGYTAPTPAMVDRANRLKEAEERILRLIDEMQGDPAFDPRWVAVARTHVQEGTMAACRAVFQPSRIALPEDPV